MNCCAFSSFGQDSLTARTSAVILARRTAAQGLNLSSGSIKSRVMIFLKMA